jgi:hypothetical protein
MFTCFIRYWIEPNKLEEFRQYAHTWISLIKKYGGTHHGYFIPGTDDNNLPDPAFSFPGLGTEGPVNVAVALLSFPSTEAYEQYRLADQWQFGIGVVRRVKMAPGIPDALY